MKIKLEEIGKATLESWEFQDGANGLYMGWQGDNSRLLAATYSLQLAEQAEEAFEVEKIDDAKELLKKFHKHSTLWIDIAPSPIFDLDGSEEYPNDYDFEKIELGMESLNIAGIEQYNSILTTQRCSTP